MVKVSITLPNNAQITFESEEPEVIHEIVGMVLRDLPRDLMRSGPAANGGSGNAAAPSGGVTETIRGVNVERVPADAAGVPGPPAGAGSFGASPPRPGAASPATESRNQIAPEDLAPEDLARESLVRGVPAPEAAAPEDRALEPQPGVDAGPAAPEAVRERPSVGGREEAPPTDARREFVDFCRSANPLGDMRRVVVAAEGASRFLGVGSVDEEALGGLFDLAGWPRPHSFIQTLRNAARTKFRWLERIPGRAGHYRVTEIGRATALG